MNHKISPRKHIRTSPSFTNPSLQIAAALFLSAFLLTTTSLAAAPPPKTYKVAIRITSTGGLGAGQVFDMMLKLMKRIEEESGVRLEIVRVDNYDDTATLFLQGKIDIMPIWPFHYKFLKDHGARILPIATMTIDGQTKRAECFWTERTTTIRDVKDILGKTIVSYPFDNNIITPYITMRYFLKAHNINRPLWEVFSNFALTPNQNSMFMALALKKADIAWATTDEKVFMKAMNSQIVAKLRPVFCSDYIFERWAYVGNGKTISPDDYKKILLAFDAIIKNLNNEPDFKPFLPMARMVRGSFKFNPSVEFKTETLIQKEAEKHGWLDEARYFTARMNEIPAGKIQPIPPPNKSAPECRKLCRKNKYPDPCVDKCMR